MSLQLFIFLFSQLWNNILESVIRNSSKTLNSSTKESSKMHIFSTLLLPIASNISFSQGSHTQRPNSLKKSINKPTPPVFHHFSLLSQTVHLYGTRQASRGDLFQTNKNAIQYGLRSMQYFGSKLWNTIPIIVTNLC